MAKDRTRESMRSAVAVTQEDGTFVLAPVVPGEYSR
jgi:hypothetical protein